MDFELDDEQVAFRTALCGFLDSLDLEAYRAAEGERDEMDPGPTGRALLREMGARGWLGVGSPTAYGGQGRSAVETWLYIDELARRRLPNGGQTVLSVAPTIMRAGSEEQQRTLLPGMMLGEIHCAVAYTEPRGGSDLAALDTRAVRDGDSYVINGQKVYITEGHFATHVFLAVRTGPREARHRGISVLVLAMDTPGVAVRPLQTQADLLTNEIFFDDVRVPVSARLGEENEGWDIIKLALDFERILPYGSVAREFEELVRWAAQTPAGDDGPPAILADPVQRQSLAELAVDLEVTRLFGLRAAWMIDDGQVPNAEASINKVWLSELEQHLASTALGVMGECGQAAAGTEDAPLRGHFERRYRYSPVVRFGGGTNEVQRDIIARRGLGLPR